MIIYNKKHCKCGKDTCPICSLCKPDFDGDDEVPKDGWYLSKEMIPALKSDFEIIEEVEEKIIGEVIVKEKYYENEFNYWSTIEKKASKESSERKYEATAEFWMGEIGNGSLYKTPRTGTF